MNKQRGSYNTKKKAMPKTILAEAMQILKDIEYYFHDKGLTTIDIQQEEPSTGISNGWVIFEDSKGKVKEMHYEDEVYHLKNNSTKAKLFSSAFNTTAIL